MLAGVGLAGCMVLAFSLPAVSVVVGAGVLVAGAVVYGVRGGRGPGRGGRRAAGRLGADASQLLPVRPSWPLPVRLW
ncbi:hypothetical protein GCM10010270_69930 [Streptomyces violaceus]|nr:hypothetical protein GCM10010270_69930 [Streptomyces janthinus]